MNFAEGRRALKCLPVFETPNFDDLQSPQPRETRQKEPPVTREELNRINNLLKDAQDAMKGLQEENDRLRRDQDGSKSPQSKKSRRDDDDDDEAGAAVSCGILHHDIGFCHFSSIPHNVLDIALSGCGTPGAGGATEKVHRRPERRNRET